MTDKPRVLDLFCNAGGAAVGYARAGFEVVGVDIDPQPNYPFRFVQGDAITFVTMNGPEFDLVHASPPCQYGAAITLGTNKHRRHLHQDLYPRTLSILKEVSLPYVIENPDARPDVVLCGEMFGLSVIRHRKIELGGWSTEKPKHVKHRGRVRGWRHGKYFDGPYIAAYGNGGGKGSAQEMREAMGIDWTDDRDELVEMLPPAYTEWIGRAFLAQRAEVG
jgi:SAM-dependent methyltransferase